MIHSDLFTLVIVFHPSLNQNLLSFFVEEVDNQTFDFLKFSEGLRDTIFYFVSKMSLPKKCLKIEFGGMK